MIQNKIIKTELLDWEKFEFIQSNTFKEFSKDAQDRLRKSMLKNNFIECFNVWENKGKIYCLDGFHRCKVLRELKAEGISVPEKLPANFVQCENRKEAAKLVLIYSSIYAKIAEDGLADFLLTNEISFDDVEMEIDLPHFEGFAEEEHEEEKEVTDVDIEEDEISEDVFVQRGDMFRLGEHYVLCGDSSDYDDVLTVTQGQKCHGAFTSPPYALQRKDQYGGVPAEEYVDWFESIQSSVSNILHEKGSFFVNIKPNVENGCRTLYVNDLVSAFVRLWDWKFVEEYCWTHQGFPGEYAGRFKNQFEPVYHFSKVNGGKIIFRPENVLKELSDSHFVRLDRLKNGEKPKQSESGMTITNYSELDGARPGNVILANNGVATGHPASFPIQLPEFFIQAFSDKNDIWFEPFGGSGTTLLACEKHKRQCRLLEIQPQYVQLIVKRYIKFCKQNDIAVDFQHVNGTLTIDKF